MKVVKYSIFMIIVGSLIACGGGSGDSADRNLAPGGVTPTPAPTPPEATPDPTAVPTSEPDTTEVRTTGPHSTGSVDNPVFVYFDLDTNEVMTLSEEEAAANSDWDIAFQRTQVFLNSKASSPVEAYFTKNNGDFYDETGAPIADKFTLATPDSELSDLSDFDSSLLPGDEEFTTDIEELAIGGKFYNYDQATHVVTAAADRYFVVQSLGNFSKFRAKAITTNGRTMSSLTLGVSFQDVVGQGDTEFLAEQDIELDLLDCSGDIYFDFDTLATVEELDDWDIRLPCVTVEENTGADFEIILADQATAFEDVDNITGIDTIGLDFYGFRPNLTLSRFFDEPAWYAYNLQGNHGIWSQYGVYLIKTATAIYKFQILGYYDAEGVSGNYTFRYQALP